MDEAPTTDERLGPSSGSGHTQHSPPCGAHLGGGGHSSGARVEPPDLVVPLWSSLCAKGWGCGAVPVPLLPGPPPEPGVPVLRDSACFQGKGEPRSRFLSQVGGREELLPTGPWPSGHKPRAHRLLCTLGPAGGPG